MRGKGVVVEISEKNRVIIMTSQGEFLKVSFKKPVCVGQEIQFSRRERPSLWQLSAAAVFVFAFFGSIGVFENFYVPGGTAAAYFVTLDINPSIELTVNRDNRVVKAEGLNREGRGLVEQIRVTGRPVQDVVNTIGARAEEEGYLVGDQHEVVVTICSPEDKDAELTEIEPSNPVGNELGRLIVATLKTAYKANVRVWQVPERMRREAKLAGLTPARYIAVIAQPTQTRPQVVLASTSIRPTPSEPAPVRVAVRDEEQESTENTQSTDRVVRVERPSLAPVNWTRSTVQAQRAYDIQMSLPIGMKGELHAAE